MKNQLPNALTLLNLVLGTMAIIALSNDHIQPALIMMGGCLLADALDGAIARLMKVESNIGIQLDSLADIVSFGVLPAMMLFTAGTKYGMGMPQQVVLSVFAGLTAASAGLRLARFNIDDKPRKYFYGLATPAGAMLVGGWLWAEYIDRDYGFGFSEIPWLAIIISVFLIIAYHVHLKLPNLKSPKQGFVTAAFLVISVLIGVFTIGPISIPMGVIIYVLLGLLNLGLKWY